MSQTLGRNSTSKRQQGKNLRNDRVFYCKWKIDGLLQFSFNEHLTIRQIQQLRSLRCKPKGQQLEMYQAGNYTYQIKFIRQEQLYSMKTQVYPQDYSCILPPQGSSGGIFIGNLQAAQNIRTLQKHAIRAVLTAAKGIVLDHPKHLVPQSLVIPADDHDSFDLSIYFHKAADFIHNAVTNTNIMVHCLAGVSRSVSLVLAYLIKHKKMGYEEAYGLVKSRRKIIHPNDGFIRQLKLFAQENNSHGQPSPPLHYYNRYPSPKTIQRRNLHSRSIQQFQSSRRHLNFSPTEYRFSRKALEGMNLSPERTLSRGNTNYKNYVQNMENRTNPAAGLIGEPRNQAQEREARMKRVSLAGAGQNRELLAENRKQDFLKVINGGNSVDTAEIDRKIEQIRKKYQQFTGSTCGAMIRYPERRYQPENMRREQGKRRQYNYLNEFERSIRPANTSNYNYTPY